MEKNSLLVSMLLITSAMMCSGCASAPENTEVVELTPVEVNSDVEATDGKALNIVTTFVPLYAHAANLIDGNDTLTNLVPAGTSVHFWQPKPSDVLAMEEADLIITNGLGLEEFLDDYLEDLEKKGVMILDTSEGVETMEFGEDEHEDEEHEDEEHEDEEHDDHHHEGPDPHIWLDPTRTMTQVDNITTSFIALDSNQEQVYTESSGVYKSALEALHTRLEDQFANADISPFIVFHDAYQYFLHAYDLESYQVGLVQEFHGDNPSQQDIADLITRIIQSGVRTIYTEPQFNPSVVSRLTQETGVNNKEVDPLGNELSKQGYIRMIEVLAEAFVSA